MQKRIARNDCLPFITNYQKRLAADDRVKPIHISLAMALCQNWAENHFVSSFRVSRRLLMRASRIMSTATYHKALRELQAFGYVSYDLPIILVRQVELPL